MQRQHESGLSAVWGLAGNEREAQGFPSHERIRPGDQGKVRFCFAIALKMHRQGIASLLWARVCQDATEDGFDFMEAHPDKEVTAKSEDFWGYAAMYEKFGFTVCDETNRKLVTRKPLK